MSRKSKGINAEREIIKLFAETGAWYACRVAGSGNVQLPAPDIIAGSKDRKIAIECKCAKEDKKYLNSEDVEQMREFSTVFGAEAWFAVKFNRKGWQFLRLEDLKPTKTGFCIERGEKNAVGFKEVVSARI